jgi:broad specificity phosphatase PhoE
VLDQHQQCVVVYVCRHGSTALNAQGCFRGHNDVPLDQQGVRDAHKLASLFENIDIAHIISSDRIRAMSTAKIIADRKGMEAVGTPSLHAWDVGEFSGQPKDEANKAELEWYVQHPRTEIPDGESLAAFKARVRPCIIEAMDMADHAGEPVLLVGHSSIVHEVGDMFYDDHYSLLVEPGGAIAIYVEDGKVKAQPIFKERTAVVKSSADTVS